MSKPISKITIVGAGAIGQSLGLIFAAHDIEVSFYDAIFEADKSNIEKVKSSLARRVEALDSTPLPTFILDKFTISDSLPEILKDADIVYECVFENQDVKRDVLQKIDEHISDSTVFMSSTSCIMPSVLSGKLKNKENFLVAHPVNPPFYLRLVEIVPAPWTKPSAVEKVKQLMQFVGQKPICLQKEVDGFALNRVQYAVINSSWNLVKDGVLSPEDVDKVMLYGLGPRYAAIGPFQTMQTNAPGGIKDYMERYEEGMRRVSKATNIYVDYDKETLETVGDYLDQSMPVAELGEAIKKRDEVLKIIRKVKTD